MKNLIVIGYNQEKNPICEHGPTVLFRLPSINGSHSKQFFACSASRDGSCTFRINQGSSKKNTHSNKSNERYVMIRNTPVSRKVFCIKCQELVVESEIKNHVNHPFLNKLTEKMLKEPTRILSPLSVDKSEAQYFFTGSTLLCIYGIFKQLKITKVVCLGAPRLHEYLVTKTKIVSLLLDIDNRFRWFYNDTRFLQYNMFNNYFYDGTSAQNVLIQFLKIVGSSDIICIFADPPFGCRSELLAQTIRQLNELYNQTNSYIQNILPVFWVYPYFMEIYIRKEIPSMEMSDYRINYTNHKTYNNNKKHLKNGSPVRLFTNVALDLFSLPKSNYQFCSKCHKWVSRSNRHCVICNNCTSKNNVTYRHCLKCNWCVKPNYQHCDKCGRCSQVQGHICKLYRKKVTCRICLLKGHVENMCSIWEHIKGCKQNASGCVVCGSKSHIVSDCLERKRLLNEEYFLGSYNNIINMMN
ncbi:rRNA N6-adenosine-methyltransferase ZCCHC4 isoform X2 [Malaya genurostris]|uniref:rRNA N6-adenosine-methyltransferase ZCCHC4 isoform X2 n=1 Tax=Malaya genurostris TaxID=325434 RepID=UPI0026F396C7|nr:rRNA N6-adenosine-methyltransferase ZCCHC4 isoform X2 [Malaya genurostris]